MGALGRVLAICFVLVAAGWAIAQSPNGPPDYQLLKGDAEQGIPPQNCWECHKPGAYVPPMDPYITLLAELTEIPAGATGLLDFNTIISNVWIGQENGAQDYYGFRATLDISDAPSFSFVSDREPPAPQSVDGVIAFDAGTTNVPIVNQEVPVDPTSLQAVQWGHSLIEMPAGVTSATIRVVPGDTSAQTGPDIRVNIYPGVSEPSGDPYNEDPIDDAGRGGAEEITFGNADFGATGYGNWTIDVGYVPVTSDGQLTPPAQDVPYTVEVEASFDASDATQITQVDDSQIFGGESLLMPWTVQIDDPQPGEVLRFTLNFTVHYEHQSEPEPNNYRDLTEFFEVEVTEAPAGGYRIGSEDSVIIIPSAPTGVSIAAISEVIGYIGAFLLIASVWTGGMFGKASRRQLNVIFGSARRRVAFHNFLSYGIIAFSLVHMFIFMWDVNGPLAVDGYHWLVGLLWGGQGVLAMLALGVTGALQVPMIRKWNYNTWRWLHFGLAIAAIVFTVVHMLLDGANFSAVQDALGYEDPLVPEGF